MGRLAQLTKLLEADPRDAFVLYGIAQEHAKAGRHGEAVEWFDRCLAVDAAYCYAYYHKAKALEADGKQEHAIETLRSGLGAARKAGDQKAMSEMRGFLDELE
ncbi:MAG: hypothetical protein ACKVW3_17650 [Phycisphaerales bacterium]